jgi:hypothetical protein
MEATIDILVDEKLYTIKRITVCLVVIPISGSNSNPSNATTDAA